jgi:heme-degrading monooxygenase HmoA
MENAPVITLTFRSPAPGADPEVWARYIKWSTEVYVPLVMKTPMVSAVEQYKIVKESPEYPFFGSIMHYENNEVRESYRETTERNAIEGEVAAWTKRGIADYFWRVAYELVKSIRSETVSIVKEGTIINNASFINMEAYQLSPGEDEKYEQWLNDYGYNIFLPLFLKVPGLRGYDCFKCVDIKGTTEARETKYPLYLSIVYFENIEAFDNYAKSAELVVLQKGLRNVFPRGPVYKWYVQYQLVKSWRK